MKKIKTNYLIGKLVTVAWNDISKITNSESGLNEDANIDNLYTTLVTVGIYYKETKDTVLLAQEYWVSPTGENIVRDWVVIPKSVIKEIRV